MAELHQIDCRLDPGGYLGEISALAFIPLPHRLSSLPLLLAGSGSELLVYDIKRGTLLKTFHVFQGIRVHGISLRPGEPEDEGFSIAVYGEKRVKLLALRLDGQMGIDIKIVGRMPRLDHWVLDACFLKEDNQLAVGLSDNSIAFWDVDSPDVILRVKSPERCLLYSMRIWGDSIEALRVASGTIYNEIIVWELQSQDLLPCSAYSMDFTNQCIPDHDKIQFHGQGYLPIHLNRLIGHEGSIFRMAWSSDGSKLISVSDDRSARIWIISGLGQACGDLKETTDCQLPVDLVLFGHNARIWDCCISDPIVITAGEDCTCRVWGMNGKQHSVIKEHIGRGIWRCLYDPASNLLVTAGFDSAIKVHYPSPSFLGDMSVHTEVSDENQTQSYIVSAPKVSILKDSKSEYVRCLRFSRENDLYVATNNGYLYHVQLSYPCNPTWTELALVSKEAPIICMDLMLMKSSMEDIIAIGDGKGNATVIRVVTDGITPKSAVSSIWSAEKERQLLGVHWCNSLGCNYLFTVDPRGILKLWSLRDALNSDADNIVIEPEVFLIAVFTSSIGARIMCLHASIEEEVLMCGDLRGNLIVFPLSKGLILANPSKMVEKVSSLSQFKGAHGISCVTSILISTSTLHPVEVLSTGRDGCICHFRYNKSAQKLEFTGMKQMKELTTIQAVPTKSTSEKNLAQGNYAVGFLSSDFIIWNLTNESKIIQVPCGGWRRPYSYYLGDVPEYQNCFAFLKDHNIHIHRVWVPVRRKQLIPKMLHIQYHGRETHSVCFISSALQTSALSSRFSWLATGCEDGTVRVTRYTYFDSESWCESKLLGEHVGGSAVRSIFFVSEIYTFTTRANWNSNHALADDQNDELLLISVGAKQVLTCWVLQKRDIVMKKLHLNSSNVDCDSLSSPTMECSSISFEWLSTHMPPKLSSNQWKMKKKPENTENVNGLTLKSCFCGANLVECHCRNLNSTLLDQHENDWRYLAVTAFLVKHADSRLKVCFVVVACSDTTLMLRALLLPFRLWIDVAALVSESSPILALQHLVIPGSVQTKDDVRTGNAYFLISGSTDGSITFWDLTENIECFLERTSKLSLETLVDSQRRPQTGRGSQGGRWGRSCTNQSVEDSLIRTEVGHNSDERNSGSVSFDASLLQGSESAKSQSSNISSEICEIRPLYVLSSVHQSGVNCLHLSERKGSSQSESGLSYCILSGGDDQAVHYLAFDLTPPIMNCDSYSSHPDYCTNHLQDGEFSRESGINFIEKSARLSMQQNHYHLRILNRDTVISAHSSAVKGIWTDGIWAFSTGLDQRIRCWKIGGPCGKLTEHAHLIACVPEPEALDAINCDSSGRYKIAVAGRGIQMVDFCASVR